MSKTKKNNLKFNKNAQMIGQVFVFILAAFVFSLILFYGYQYIDKILEHQREVELVDFKITLEKSVEEIKYLQGSVRQLKLRIPGGNEKVCFGDSKNAVNNQRFPMLAHIAQTSGQNVFLIPLQDLNIKIDNLIVDNGICCLPAEPSLVIRLEVEKNGVSISPWEDYLQCE